MHPGSEHAIVVFEGRGSIQVGEVEEMLEPLKGIRVLPGRPHRVRNDGRGCCCATSCAPRPGPTRRSTARPPTHPPGGWTPDAASGIVVTDCRSVRFNRHGRRPRATSRECSTKKPSKTVTSIGVVAFIIAAAITGLSAIPGTPWSGFIHPILLFFGVFFGVFLLGLLLDRAARNARRR